MTSEVLKKDECCGCSDYCKGECDNRSFKAIMKYCLDKQKVRQALDEFEEVLIDALGWNKPEDVYNRSNLGIKFDILRAKLRLEEK